MKLRHRFILFLVFMLVCEALFSLFAQTADPVARTTLSLNAVNGDASSNIQLRSYEEMRQRVHVVIQLGYVGVLYLIFTFRRPDVVGKTK